MNNDRFSALKQRADALCQKKLRLMIPEIRRHEAGHFLIVSQEYGRFEAQFELFYDLITEILLGVNYIDNSSWPKHRVIQFLLVNNNLKTLYSAFDRSIKGFWEDGLNLLRTAYEVLVRITWVSCYPPRAGAGILKHDDGGRNFDLTGFIKNDLKLDWNDYKFLSMLTHGNQPAVLQDWIDIHTKSKREPISAELGFKKKELEMTINYILFVSYAYLKMTLQLFVTSCNEVLKNETVVDAKELLDIWGETLLLHPGGCLPVYVKDLDDILRMMEGADGGHEWKELWSKIRAAGTL